MATPITVILEAEALNPTAKVLTKIFMRDAERLGQFEREAHVPAARNHPHIATIHGLEPLDGIHALVSGVVAGETLA